MGIVARCRFYSKCFKTFVFGEVWSLFVCRLEGPREERVEILKPDKKRAVLIFCNVYELANFHFNFPLHFDIPAENKYILSGQVHKSFRESVDTVVAKIIFLEGWMDYRV